MNVSENLSAANGRIVDADFAAETATLTKQQILTQAGVAMLAQAKAAPAAWYCNCSKISLDLLNS